MFASIGNYIHMTLSGDGNTPSSKRVIILVCTILMITGFLGNEFFHKTVDTNMFNSIMYIIIGGMGITGAEKFAPKETAIPADASSDTPT